MDANNADAHEEVAALAIARDARRIVAIAIIVTNVILGAVGLFALRMSQFGHAMSYAGAGPKSPEGVEVIENEWRRNRGFSLTGVGAGVVGIAAGSWLLTRPHRSEAADSSRRGGANRDSHDSG